MSLQERDQPSSPRLVDTHCHLDDDSFSKDLDGVLERAALSGVDRWINVGYAPERWQSTIELRNRMPGISIILGMHPGHADEWNEETARELERLVQDHRPVAIGEIGLDFFRGETNHTQQIRALNDQLDLALAHDLPVVIHMRSSDAELRDVLDSRASLPPILFHSFDGSPRLADWIQSHDAWIGVGGLATRGSQQDLRAFISRMSHHRVVLETDSPYLVPNGFKHRRNTPESIPAVAETLARIWQVSIEEVASVTTANAENLFVRLPSHVTV